MKSTHLFVKTLFFAWFLTHTVSVSLAQIADTSELKRILHTLASDEMRGRSALSPADIGRAADFIAEEYEKAGLVPYSDEGFRQTFEVIKVAVQEQRVSINGEAWSDDQFLVYGAPESLEWSATKPVKSRAIAKGTDFSKEFRAIVQDGTADEIIWVDSEHAKLLARFKNMMGDERLVFLDQDLPSPTKVFIVTDQPASAYTISASTVRTHIPMFNMVGVLPGKSKPDEYVIFSGHYDHIGILPAVGQDSIANGADDDASGVTAVIALAEHFKKADINERTLLFVAFTAEEIGMFGSKHFSSHIDPDQVVAMINIEMIGKDARFGPNSMYMTGFDASNLGTLLQENVQETAFTFHPDPYPQQNLFYRSDNATLAALGVPAHTVSTVQIEKDEYYHTVKDEVGTLDIENIKSSIEAIAKGTVGLVNGTQTPTRVEKLR